MIATNGAAFSAQGMSTDITKVRADAIVDACYRQMARGVE